MSNDMTKEDLAECRRLFEELSDVTEGMTDTERDFVSNSFERCQNYGDSAHFSRKQFDWVRIIYEKYL